MEVDSPPGTVEIDPENSETGEIDSSSNGDISPTPSQPPAISGPRPAPAYTAVTAIIEKKEDGAGSRCGHTLTAISAVGEEGSAGYVGPRLVLFGGATALEGSSAAPPSSAGSAGIRKLNFLL